LADKVKNAFAIKRSLNLAAVAEHLNAFMQKVSLASVELLYHDTQNNDIQHNFTKSIDFIQHNNTQHNSIQYNDIYHNDIHFNKPHLA
jgi:hypothetical protein